MAHYDQAKVNNALFGSGWLTSAAVAALPRPLSASAGLALVVAGGVVWLGSVHGPLEAVIRVFASLALIVAGGALVQLGTDDARREILVDPEKQEVLVVRSAKSGDTLLLARMRYDDIAHIDASDTEIEFCDNRGRVLASVPLDGSHARLVAMAQLRSHLPHFA